MLFNSFAFFIFFCLFYSLYWKLGSKFKLQNILILCGSYFFYGWWDPRFLILIILSTVTDYISALGIVGRKVDLKYISVFLLLSSVLLNLGNLAEAKWIIPLVVVYLITFWSLQKIFSKVDKRSRRNAWLAISMIFNLGMLGFFKYFNFFADSLYQLGSTFGLSINEFTLSVILPVGISFYTFQTMSYTIDVYRGQLKPSRKFIEFSAYVAFFPQLVAGPIERAKHLLPQFMKPRSITRSDFNGALWLFMWGLYKKVVIADNLAKISDEIFLNPIVKSSGDLVANGELVAALIAFTFQIYCDFSGYSDMAIALARMLGFDFMENFNVPYFAKTPSDFWRRWHISLSTWLRDYLYIPLGGNRSTPIVTYRNLMITMVLGGLWHGASWLFILWGAFHGVILCVYRLLNVDRWLHRRNGTALVKFFQDLCLIALMFLLTSFSWLLFRAESLETVGVFLQGIMLFPLSFISSGDDIRALHNVFFYILPLILLDTIQFTTGYRFPYEKLPRYVSIHLQMFVVFSIIALSSQGGGDFIYFDF